MPRMIVPHRPMRRPLVAAVALSLTAAAVSSVGAMAAASPTDAVQALVERVVSGDFEDLTGVVCPEKEDGIREEFDPASSAETFGSVQVEIADPVVTVVSEDEASAVVHLAGTMRISFDEEQAREFVRAQLEASGEDASDASVDAMLGLLRSLAGEDIPLDEDLTVIQRDGDWLVCDDGGSDVSFSDAGMCGLVTPDELGAIAPIALQSNNGEGDYCQWIGADDSGYFSVDVWLIRDATLEEYSEADPGAQVLTVGGDPAIGTGGQLYVAVDDGLLFVSPYLDESPDPDADPIAFATTVAELFLPRLGDLPAPDQSDAGSGAGPLGDCSIIDLEAIDALSPLQYDSVTASDGSCALISNDLAAGAPFLSISIDPSGTLDDMDVIFPDGVEGDVAGHPSFRAVDTLWVQLDEGLMTVTPVFAGSPAAADLDVYAYASDVAEVVIDALAGRS
jgi:hypothetical protein